MYQLGSATFNTPLTVDGYTPKNMKLLTYPYSYFTVSNNAGTCQSYRYEDFTGYLTFNVEGTFGVSGNVKAIPVDYKNMNVNENALDYSISAPKYPVCSWKSDSYTNWLTQNSVNMSMQWRSELVRTGLGLATSIGQGIAKGKELGTTGMAIGAGVGAVSSLIESGSKLIGLAKEQYLAKTQANFIPDQVHGNLNAGDFVWAKYRSPFTFRPMSVKARIARCIDDYFSQFGYQTNRIKLPNITGRRNWNYVKTTGCYIEGDIPQSDLAEIKNMFDNGVTFWHNPATFADYSQNNDII